MTTSDFGSPLSSSTAQSTSMPSLEQPTTSFQEGSGQASLNQTSSSQGRASGAQSTKTRASHQSLPLWLFVEKFLLSTLRLICQTLTTFLPKALLKVCKFQHGRRHCSENLTGTSSEELTRLLTGPLQVYQSCNHSCFNLTSMMSRAV